MGSSQNGAVVRLVEILEKKTHRNFVGNKVFAKEPLYRRSCESLLLIGIIFRRNYLNCFISTTSF